MIFQVQKEYKYLVIGIAIIYYSFMIIAYDNNFVIFSLLIMTIFISNMSHKITFVENNYIEFHRYMTRSKKIYLVDIKAVIRGTHSNSIIYNKGICKISHLIENYSKLTDLIEQSIKTKQDVTKELSYFSAPGQTTNPNNAGLFSYFITIILWLITVSLAGILLFRTLVESF